MATGGMIVSVTVILPAQWSVTTKGVPMTPDGKPNLHAPAPKMTDGRTPDLSGLWDVEKRPCIEATSPFGCSDALDGVPVGFINVTTGAAEHHPCNRGQRL